MVEKIILSNGSRVLIDDEDFEWLSKFKWHSKGNGYAMRSEYNKGKYKGIIMHREIMKAKKGEYVDHINGDKSDNRKSNLRIVTNQENAFNQGLRSNNKSGYKGVTWAKNREKWNAQITNNYKRISLGYFDCKHEAAKAYNEKAYELWGEYAKLNEITKEYFEL